MNWFYNLLIGLGGAIVGFLAFADEIARKIRYVNGIKSLLFKFPIFLLGTGMFITGSILKDNEDADSLKMAQKDFADKIDSMNSQNREERLMADSVNRIKIQQAVDSSYNKSVKTSNEALGKYNLMLVDSLRNVSNRINTNTSLAQLSLDAVGETPPIYLKREDSQTELAIRIMSANATSYNIHLGIYIIDDLKNQIVYSINDQSKESFLVPERKRTLSGAINDTILNYEKLLVVLYGNFTRDASDMLTRGFITSHYFDFKNNKMLNTRDDISYDQFKQFLRSKGIPAP